MTYTRWHTGPSQRGLGCMLLHLPPWVRVGGARPPLFTTILPSPVKLQCTLQLSGQIHWPCFISTNICTLWYTPPHTPSMTKGVGPGRTLAWPGWKQPDIPVEVDTDRHETSRSMWYCVNGMPQKETLDRAAYTCMLVSYRRLSPQFQFSLSGVTLVYLSQCPWPWYSVQCTLIDTQCTSVCA